MNKRRYDPVSHGFVHDILDIRVDSNERGVRALWEAIHRQEDRILELTRRLKELENKP